MELVLGSTHERGERALTVAAPKKTGHRAEPAVLDVRSSSEWEQWLTQNCDSVSEGVWLRFFKKGSG